MTKPRILTLVRHAKSSWGDPGMRDIDRPLNKRGMRDAPRMAEWLSKQIARPDLILSSPAQRARMTAEVMARAFAIPEGLIRYEDDIYYRGTTSWLDLIRSLGDAERSVLLVGHNPTVSDVGTHLLGVGYLGFATCAVCALAMPSESWALAGSQPAELLFTQAPKLLDQTSGEEG